MTVNFEYLVENVPEDALRRLVEELRQIPGVQDRLIGLEEAGYKKRPGIPFLLFSSPGVSDEFEQALERLLSLGSP